MQRLERLGRAELIEMVLRMQRPERTSRTSSKPPSTDREEQRERSKPGGAKSGHEGHNRVLSDDVAETVSHFPETCPCCRTALSPELASEQVSVHERIELPVVKPVVERHRRLAVQCPGCGTRVVAAMPAAVASTPFGPRLHAVATYLKSSQALSYERLQATLLDLFGLTVSQDGLMNMLRRAKVVASDETGVRIEGSNAYHWVSRCKECVVHHAAPTRAASVVREVMDGHKPEVWLSDRYSAQQGHAATQQTCLAHLARDVRLASLRPDVAYALEASEDPVPLRLKLWLHSAFALADSIPHLAASTLAAKRRALKRRLAAILAAPTSCDLARKLQGKVRRARDQLLTSAAWGGEVQATNNACERDLRPAVIQRRSPTAIAPCGPPRARPTSAPSSPPPASRREPAPSTPPCRPSLPDRYTPEGGE